VKEGRNSGSAQYEIRESPRINKGDEEAVTALEVVATKEGTA
jgi:hypothetical protein